MKKFIFVFDFMQIMSLHIVEEHLHGSNLEEMHIPLFHFALAKPETALDHNVVDFILEAGPGIDVLPQNVP